MSPYRLRRNIILPICVCLICGPVWAAEFYARAPVVSVEPIREVGHQRHLAQACLEGKPQTDSLVELLDWDLGTRHCEMFETSETIIAYRVFYRWDDKVFSQELPDHPGETIPVRVVLN